MQPHPRLRRRLRLLPLALAAALLASACGGEEEVITIIETETVAAPEPATSAAAPPQTEAPPATEATAPAATAAPPESTEPATDAPPAPEQFTLGGDTGEEPPPPDTTEIPPASIEEPPAEETVDPGVERPADFPTRREQRLLSLLYEDIANQCTRSQPADVTKGANASIYCDMRSGDKVQAWYESFPNVAAMRRAYDRFRTGRGVGPNVRSCQPGQRYPAEAPWFIGEAANTKGRLLCFVDDGDVWFVWSDDRYASLGWAVNRGGKKKVVWDYWAGRGLLGAAG